MKTGMLFQITMIARQISLVI